MTIAMKIYRKDDFQITMSGDYIRFSKGTQLTCQLNIVTGEVFLSPALEPNSVGKLFWDWIKDCHPNAAAIPLLSTDTSDSVSELCRKIESIGEK